MDASIEDQNLPLPWLRQGIVITTAGLPNTHDGVRLNFRTSKLSKGGSIYEGGRRRPRAIFRERALRFLLAIFRERALRFLQQSSGNEPCDSCLVRFQT